ncbi:MAG: sugar transferase [Firmicutes bacterium]|nr:sugar transferase [Bacillota bacterium]
MKRLIDILGALVGLVVFAPLFLLIYILIKTTDPGPAIFKQKRMGKNGNTFYIYKFRTMVQNAEEMLRNDPILYREYQQNNYTLPLHRDPRISKTGCFLRKTSLDELPQLFNVLLGEMSLVGPRPVIEEEAEHYGDNKKIFFSVRPGMTGYWQVSGRDRVGYPQRVKVELDYIAKQNLWFDLKIILKTIRLLLQEER